MKSQLLDKDPFTFIGGGVWHWKLRRASYKNWVGDFDSDLASFAKSHPRLTIVGIAIAKKRNLSGDFGEYGPPEEAYITVTETETDKPRAGP